CITQLLRLSLSSAITSHSPTPMSGTFSLHDPATTQLYTLSLHDALPLSCGPARRRATAAPRCWPWSSRSTPTRPTPRRSSRRPRSEEHTSELQSRENLVCRLLLEKKKGG